MLVLRGSQSSGHLHRQPGQSAEHQCLLHCHTLLGKTASVLCEGTTLISPSAQCHHTRTPPGSGQRPCTTPFPQLHGKVCSKDAGNRVRKEKVMHRQQSLVLQKALLYCSFGWGKAGGRWGKAILLQRLSVRRSDLWRALAILLPAGRSQLRAIRVEAEKAPL